ncbi:hypothetical protein [Magnetofaba australis]|uniref:Putative tail length determinator protein n=1 Tax=Magnetofaba australis IT-1 TaxID=1434232 RepID=A0A1Y2K0U2_9PROT|nr:hypothetical protein [Magnetofaba australis]OSM01651.1 putative tail length determinator protein [Magnetofaba australis IT-1]
MSATIPEHAALDNDYLEQMRTAFERRAVSEQRFTQQTLAHAKRMEKLRTDMAQMETDIFRDASIERLARALQRLFDIAGGLAALRFPTRSCCKSQGPKIETKFELSGKLDLGGLNLGGFKLGDLNVAKVGGNISKQICCAQPGSVAKRAVELESKAPLDVIVKNERPILVAQETSEQAAFNDAVYAAKTREERLNAISDQLPDGRAKIAQIEQKAIATAESLRLSSSRVLDAYAVGAGRNLQGGELDHFAQEAAKMSIAFRMSGEAAAKMRGQWRKELKLNATQSDALANYLSTLPKSGPGAVKNAHAELLAMGAKNPQLSPHELLNKWMAKSRANGQGGAANPAAAQGALTRLAQTRGAGIANQQGRLADITHRIESSKGQALKPFMASFSDVTTPLVNELSNHFQTIIGLLERAQGSIMGYLTLAAVGLYKSAPLLKKLFGKTPCDGNGALGAGQASSGNTRRGADSQTKGKSPKIGGGKGLIGRLLNLGTQFLSSLASGVGRIWSSLKGKLANGLARAGRGLATAAKSGLRSAQQLARKALQGAKGGARRMATTLGEKVATFGSASRSMAKALYKRVSPVQWVMRAMAVKEIAMGDAPVSKKLQQGAALAGDIAGGSLGASIGAAVGTMILPGIGTVIGGLLGGALGSIGGEEIGASLGEKISSFFGFGNASPADAAPTTPHALSAMQAPPSQPSVINYSPNTTIQIQAPAALLQDRAGLLQLIEQTLRKRELEHSAEVRSLFADGHALALNG